MSVMKEKFVQDFIKADAVDTAIITFQVALSTGVKMLDGLIPKIEMDMRILDEARYKEIKGKIKVLTSEFNSEADKIKSDYSKVSVSNDPYDEDSLKNRLNDLKHGKQQKILSAIQEIAYTTGWLD